MKQKVLTIIGIIVFALLCFNGEVKAATVEPAKQTIYALDPDTAKKYNLTIPANCPKSYKITVKGNTGKPTFTPDGSYSEYALTVDENGNVTPKLHDVYWVGHGTVQEYEYGTFKVKVTVDGQTHYSEVTIKNYTTYYAENVMKDYISKNITSSMTEYEKLEKICEFVCSYDYSASSSSYTGMILSGGGDCWASTNTIVYMCKQLGIYAHSRYAVNDAGAGSGHRNALVYADGKYYIAEAGFNEKAPRYHYIAETCGWGYTVKSDGTLKLTQYDGKETNVKIPEKIRK